MFVRHIEYISLEHQDGLQIRGEVCSLEFIHSAVVFHLEFEHIEDVAIKSPAEHEVVRSLLLVVPHSEQAAVVLGKDAFDETGVIHWGKVVAALEQ